MRRDERLPLEEIARLHPNNWSSLDVRVLDLSANGFRAECEARVALGSCVRIELPEVGPAVAYVTWRRGNCFGAKFSAPVDPSRCGWPALAQGQVLARLLVERAEARTAGKYRVEMELRRKILAALPMQRLPRS